MTRDRYALTRKIAGYVAGKGYDIGDDSGFMTGPDSPSLRSSFTLLKPRESLNVIGFQIPRRPILTGRLSMTGYAEVSIYSGETWVMEIYGILTDPFEMESLAQKISEKYLVRVHTEWQPHPPVRKGRTGTILS